MSPLPQLADSLLGIDDRVATLTLDRHDVRNELTGTRLASEIASVVDWINANENIAALVITGAGSAFSAGGNIKHMLHRKGSFGGDVYEVQNKYRRGIQQMALAMHRLEVPSMSRDSKNPAATRKFDRCLDRRSPPPRLEDSEKFRSGCAESLQ